MSATENVSGKQFSQRSFADVEPSFKIKPTAEHRWPRGYTPERYHAVASVFGDYDDAPHQFEAAPVSTGRYSGHDQTKRSAAMVLRSQVIDTVARSKMNPTHLGGVSGAVEGGRILDHRAPTFAQGDPSMGPYTLGNFGGMVSSGADVGDVWAHPHINLKHMPNTPEAEYSLMHELGHHDSMLRRNDHNPVEAGVKARLKGEGLPNTHTPKKLGLEEGHADRFAHENIVYRRGQSFTRPRYSGMNYGFTGKRGETFDRAYGEAHWDKPLSSGITPALKNGQDDVNWEAANRVDGDRGWQGQLDSQPNAQGEKAQVFERTPTTHWETGKEMRVRGAQAVQKLNQMGYTGHHTLRPSR